MRKRGQFNLSFAMIFSIIVIIAIVATAIYVMTYFLNLNKCTTLGFFFDDLDNEVEKAWRSPQYQDIFEATLPSNLEFVCFGNLTQGALTSPDQEKKDELKFSPYRDENKNVFLLPSRKACSGDLANFNLEHAETSGFFCIPVENGKIEVRIQKQITGNLVKISKI